jgi:PAS domain S-box-containing protein
MVALSVMASPPRSSFFSASRPAAIVIVLTGLVASVLAFRDLRQKDVDRAEDSVFRRATFVHARITDIFGLYEDALYGLRSAFTLKGGVTQDEFTRIARHLAERTPGVQAFEWIPAVPAAERPALEAAMSRDAGGPVGFTELNQTGQLVSASTRPEYYPITYVYPLAGNERVRGYDLKTGATHTELENARQTRRMTLTGQIRLVQEKAGQLGLIMIWPVYRPAAAGVPGAGPAPEEFLGFVQAVFRVPDVLETIRAQTWGRSSILDLLFIDNSEPNPDRRILYYRPNDPRIARVPAPSEEEFRRPGHALELPLGLGGRHWSIIYRPYPGWFGDQMTLFPYGRVIGVLLLTSLIVGMVLILGRRTEVIEREVADRTAELSESRRQLSSLLHSLPGMAYRCRYDAQLEVIYVSVGVEALTGYTPAEFVSGAIHFRDLIHPGDVGRVRTATQTGLHEHRDIEVEYRLVARDGTEKWLLSRCRGVYSDDGRPLFLEGLAIDITGRKRAEQEKFAMERRLLDSQKLESLGLLAGGIAHDFNNILTGILGNASLARLKLSADSGAMSHLHKIELASVRAAELCQQMLSYAGRGSFLIEPVDLSRLVQETLPLQHVSLASRARLHLHLSPQPSVALADASQLRQIVMNFVINAADAMGERMGEIHITTGVRAFNREFLHAANDGDSLLPGDYVFIEVRDNGCGMTPEVISRIFDPFFTTKFAGRGLGLAAVRGIARGHQGALHVSSEPGRGSTFTLILPPSSRPLPAPPPVPAPARRYAGRVLVIDDEAPVREAASDLLATFGFSIMAAKDGAEGIAEFALNPAGYVLVLLDLTMPVLSGEETLVALRTLAPDVRVLLVSGYSDSSHVARLAGIGPLRFLQKPFTRDELERKLRELLG